LLASLASVGVGCNTTETPTTPADTGGTLSSGGASSTGGTPLPGGASATGGATNSGGSSMGGTISTGGTPTGGVRTTGGMSSTGGKATGGAATGGTATGGKATGGTATGGRAGGPGTFTCNLVIGNSTTQQWFEGGFLSYPQVDPTHWELYWVAHHYIGSWANPTDAGWTTPLDMGHACASNSTAPDRVIFIVTQAPPYPPEATYQDNITAIVNNIKAKYSVVKRIELTTLIRAPGNGSTACSSQPNNEQSIPAAEDQAIAAVAADPMFAGLVFALPPFYVPNCSDFVTDAPQYTAAGAVDIAQVYGVYYAAHP
jgi:hypothetical protein